MSLRLLGKLTYELSCANMVANVLAYARLEKGRPTNRTEE